MTIDIETQELNVITGAFGYTGKYITRKLLSLGKRVKTITGHPNRPNPFGNQISIAPFHFDNPAELIKNLQGATTLYNTYWVRFPYGKITYDKAVAHTKILINAAKEAGIRRLVHISITNASEESPFPYFRGKGILENVIIHSNLSYAIIRPTVIFGHEDILINNIAWFLRKLPVFAIPGEGDYRLQPVFVEDVAEIAVNAGQSNDNMETDAVGPEIFRYEELIRLIAGKVQSKARIVHLRPGLALFLSKFIGYMVNDMVLTRDEVEGLMENLLVSTNQPTGKTRLSDWLSQNASIVGTCYASELTRHYR
ncbi:MAG TPA: SDR family oxidoreductase [Candidatus Wunengus sp. YC60]|uniref:SDR family oxidoreductase n=1 Tax=Candidatus Wunengus sp. YC60 TaxID=3367697 RepID=UPI004027F8EB